MASQKEKFGTTSLVYHKLHYNVRGQLYDVRASNVNDETSGELGALVNYYSNNGVYGGSGTDNNGNVLKSQTIINSFYVEDRYGYDALNRLASVSEYQNGTTNTGMQQYDYDRWGNRMINAATWGTGINNKQFTVNTANNRLGVPVGQSGVMSYDNAGNLTNDTYTGAGNRTYDAENKITSAWGGNNQAQLYGYDASGQRIKRTVDGVETWQVYGFGSELLAEYPANGVTANPKKEYGYRNGQLLITADAPVNLANVALPANGATVSASSTMVNPPYSYPVSAINNGDRKGLNAGSGGNWLSSTATFPQWVEVDFNGSKTISEIDVFSLQDNYANPIEPTEATTFSLYGLTAFDVQYWNGSTWTTVSGGSVTGNNKVWKKISFAPLTTSKIRVLINASVDGWSRMVEVEAWTGSPANINWLVTDHLGTPRIIIDQTGSLVNVKRHDYLPFGEELFASAGGRSVALGYTSGDGVRQQFTGKERDTETGLDYFLARYYSSTAGRFTSPDSLAGSLPNPQSLNLYSYTLNNPVNLTDPTGHVAEDVHGESIDKQKDRWHTPYCKCQGQTGRPTATKPQAPPGFEIKPDGTLTKTGGGAVVEEAVTVTAERGIFRRVFSRIGRLLGFGGGPISGAAAVFMGEMIDPQPTGGGDADLGYNSYPWLTPRIQASFLNGQFSPHRLQQDTTYYRYFGPTPMMGRAEAYFSAQLFPDSAQARAMLALSPAVTGNQAQQVVEVTVPAGTIVLIGQAAPQPPPNQFPGGGSQIVVGPQTPGLKYGTPRRLP